MSTICEHIRDARAGASPLSEYLVIEFYDGFTDGVVQCSVCDRFYYARAIAFYGGPTHGSRVFVLYPMPSAANAECASIREEWGRLLDSGRIKHGRATPSINQRLRALSRRRRAPSLVFCWDLESKAVLAVAPVPARLRLPAATPVARATPESDRPWFRHLGLSE